MPYIFHAHILLDAKHRIYFFEVNIGNLLADMTMKTAKTVTILLQ